MNSIDIAVVICAYNVADFIEEAVLSVVNQAPSFKQVIVVDDCSTDKTNEILTQLAKNHNVIQIVKNQKNLGLGLARNEGMKHVTCSKLLFLDGDDFFEPDASIYFSKFIDIDFDILHFSFYDYVSKEKRFKNSINILKAPESEIVKIVDRTEILNVHNVAWNKLYDASFVRKVGIQFERGFYEDIPWTFGLQMHSTKYFATRKALVNYRRRPGSILRTVSDSHFDVFDKWKNVFQMLEQDFDLKEVFYDHLEKTRLRQLLGVVNSKDRLPTKSKVRFFRETIRLCSPIHGNNAFSRKDIHLVRRTRRNINDLK